MSSSSALRKINPLLLRHLAAGAPALLLDIVGMELLLNLGWEVHLARALSVTLATVAAFFLHRAFTYAAYQKAKTVHGQPIPFGTLQAASGVLSFGIFMRILWSLPHPVGFAGRIFALLCGAAGGFFFNYMMLNRLLPARAAKSAAKDMASPVSTKTFKRVLLWLLIFCLMLQMVRGHHQMVMDWPQLKDVLGPFDPDPFVRLAQVRQWLMGGLAGFFDHTVRNVNAPVGGIATPWTRPLDIILSIFYFFTPHSLPMTVRLLLAATWMPPCIGLGAIALLTLAARRQFDNLHVLGFVALLILFSPDTFYYFIPGDSDHHGLLSMLWCGVLAMLLRRDYAPKTALIAGGILGLMIWISPEALILTATVYALLGALMLWDARKAPGLAYTALGAAAVATFGLFVEMPPGDALTKQVFDSISIVQVSLLWLCAAAAFVLAEISRRGVAASARFFLACVAGAAVLLAEYILYPRFFSGPLADADPFIFTGFLPRVGEAKFLFSNGWEDIVRELMEPVLAAGLIAAALLRSYVRPERKLRLWILSLLLFVTTVMTLFQIRWAYYMHPVAIAAIAMTVTAVTAMPWSRPWVYLRRLPRAVRPYAVLWLAYFGMNFLIHLNFSHSTAGSLGCMTEIRYVIQTQQLQPLLGDNNQVLFTPEDSGGDTLFFTPYRIIASNYHREGAGLQEMHDIYAATTAKAAEPLLKKHQVAAMLYCPVFVPADSWLAAAANPKKRPAWMVPVKGLHFANDKDKEPLLFRLKGMK